MSARSAGILLFRESAASGVEVWIAHMGGPFWARKNEAAWTLPKGLHERDEAALDVARREFEEEIGVAAPDLDYRLLGEFGPASGKMITAFTARFDGELEWASSNEFELEWPPRSGRIQRFPEIDRAGWFPAGEARTLLVAGQRPILDALLHELA